jgi:alpha-ketoglutarate-dependent taurine dioxygenase
VPLNGIGLNLRTKTPGMRQRQYMTVEETEAAAKAKYGNDAYVARDIRALPLATGQLEDAIAGRTLINNIKDYGKRTGAETVSEGAIPKDAEGKWFTLDHPAFRTWRPKFKEKEAAASRW